MLKKEDFKTILLTSVGGMLEFYDFFIFGMFSIILGETFFPASESTSMQVLSALSVLMLGFFARPIGGLLFGYIGDKAGRKNLF